MKSAAGGSLEFVQFAFHAINLTLSHGAFFLATPGSTAEHIGLLGAIRSVAQFNLHAVLDPRPIVFIEKFSFESFEHGFWCADQIERVPFTQLLQVLFADHVPVHYPYSPFVPVLKP